MSRIENISKIISDNLTELKLVLLEKGESEIAPFVKEITTLASSPDKSVFTKLDNYKMFLTLFYLSNNDTLTFEEASKMCEEIKTYILRWNISTHGESFIELTNNTNVDGSLKSYTCYNHITKLGLTPDFINYKMQFVYYMMYYFLKLKKDLMDLTLHRKDYKLRLKTMNKVFSDSELSKFIPSMKKVIDDSIAETNERHEIATAKIKYTKEVQALLDNGTLLELTSIPDLWHHYLEPNLLEELYSIVQDNLYKSNRHIDEQITKLNHIINKTPLISYLYSNGIDPNSLDESLLKSLESKDIIPIINFLQSLNLTPYDIFVTNINLLTSLTEEKINRITFLINSNALTKKTILNHLDILDTKYNELQTNYEILKPIIDFNNLFYSDTILLKSPSTIKNILTVLSQYHLSRNNYIFLLCHYEYIDIYDLIIEKEIPSNLFIGICKTPNPLNTIKRILIYRSIGSSYATESNLLKKEVTSNDKSYLQDEELDEYLEVYSLNLDAINGSKIDKVRKNPLVLTLDEQYKVSDECYLIGNALISRPKFLRNFESIKEDETKLLPCLLSNSLITEYEYHSVYKEVKRLTLHR